MRLLFQFLAVWSLAAAGATTHAALPCQDAKIRASQVTTERDVKLFVECAAAFLEEVGPDEARRAFNEDVRWKHGATYVFVIEVALSGVTARRFVFPPNPSQEGTQRGSPLLDFGTDLYAEIYRAMDVVDTGWFYYSNPNPQTGNREFKSSYMIETDWKGTRSVIGAGLYARDLPATCHAADVSASIVSASMDDQRLQEFVRCAAMMVESRGYFAKQELETDPRWSSGGTNVFVLDMMGNQVMSSNRLRINGFASHEWGMEAGAVQFGGRDLAAAGGVFGEAFVYYRSYHPETWAYQPKVGFMKRVVAQGVPLLVGAGYFPDAQQTEQGATCSDDYVTASAVRTRDDIEAFVRCALEYVAEHGEEEARRAFNEDGRWKHGPTYLFAFEKAGSGSDSSTFVFPPDTTREGSPFGATIDAFGNDFFFEIDRVLSLVDSGWIHYAFTNPATGLHEPKASYMVNFDWNGTPAFIGAGVYERDLPGTCDPTEVNAALLDSDQTESKLREFVNCAAYQVQSSGYFAGPALTTDPRWKHGSIYLYAIDATTGETVFSGNPASFAVSGRSPELLFGGRDLIASTAAFGSGRWYFNFTNPASGMVEPKLSFTRLVMAQGVPLVIGSGINAVSH